MLCHFGTTPGKAPGAEVYKRIRCAGCARAMFHYAVHMPPGTKYLQSLSLILVAVNNRVVEIKVIYNNFFQLRSKEEYVN